MAVTNQERVGKALDLLRDGLHPFVERELKAQLGKYWITKATTGWREDVNWPEGEESPRLDIAALLRLMWEQWNEIFRKTLGHAERSLVSELREVRNKWAHQEPCSTPDAYRVLDSVARLLAAVSAPQVADLEKMRMDLLRVMTDEQVRTEKRKGGTGPIESQSTTGLKPWREVVTPHKDVASGRYQQAEFAADLWQVHVGEGSDEYKKPAEFFRRTYLTQSLNRLLVGAVQRLSGEGGDPVVQLQTSFGGGKTHSMLALYHLFSGVAPGDLPGADAVLAEAAVKNIPAVKRVVLVGNRISPGNPAAKPDGTTVRTLWGELAWQLGFAAGGAKEAKKAFGRVQADDEHATSPGDVLRELFNAYAPCLILIDEWVAYARQLHDQGDLPAGTFETHFTFAQLLTESAKAADRCLLVISLPASDVSGSPHAVADDVEVGGERGRAALERLRNAVGRVEASWRPASAEEGFEIVRRRLFEPLIEKGQFVARDSVAKAFSDLYRTQAQEFPPECREGEYEARLKAAYPIHPEIFDRLYTDWSTLLKFQRTRGVLRLMAAVIHRLWEDGDRSPLIMPSTIPISDQRVQFELTRYLSDNWVPVIEKDVDGPSALPLQLDEIPNLGRYHATRRVARTIYLGSAPTAQAAHQGIEDRRIKLGCVMPGESPAIFGDALRRLSTAATYLYSDGNRYWYSTQVTVGKLAQDRAEQLKGDHDKVAKEIEERLRADLRVVGDFSRVHPLPQSPQDIPDELDARLVVLGVDHPYSKESGSPAERTAKEILESRGTTPRLCRNTLVFLAVDRARLQDLDEAVRHYLAWDSILDDKDTLDLSPFQVKHAESQRSSANTTVTGRVPEAYLWLLVPVQATPQAGVEWQAIRLTGQDPLAVRASKKLKSEELLVTGLAGTRLRLELDRIPLWRGDHVPVRLLVEDFAKYLYLPRLVAPRILLGAVSDGIGLLTWGRETFAYADGYDEVQGRYVGLRGAAQIPLESLKTGLLVKPEVAAEQMKREQEATSVATAGSDYAVGGKASSGAVKDGGDTGTIPIPIPIKKIRRFHASATLDPSRMGRDAGRIAEEVVSHLSGLLGANVDVSLEIQVEVPEGIPENVVRIVSENANTMKLRSHGFEEG